MIYHVCSNGDVILRLGANDGVIHYQRNGSSVLQLPIAEFNALVTGPGVREMTPEEAGLYYRTGERPAFGAAGAECDARQLDRAAGDVIEDARRQA